jgi:hypothetical protein
MVRKNVENLMTFVIQLENVMYNCTYNLYMLTKNYYVQKKCTVIYNFFNVTKNMLLINLH